MDWYQKVRVCVRAFFVLKNKNNPMENIENKIEVQYVTAAVLKECEYNPRIWDEESRGQLKTSLQTFGCLDPLIVNSTSERMNVVVGGNFRLLMLKELGYELVPVVRVHLTIEKEKELNLRLNKNQGRFDFELLKEFDESFLEGVGFSSEELDSIFEDDPQEDQFSLEDELEKIGIDNITVHKGDLYELGGSRLYCGDSTIEADMLALMGNEKADMVMTDPPYRLEYLKGKTRNGESTTGFGSKKNRRYLETTELPEDFTTLWMNNVQKVAAKDFSIIVYENWKNIREVWGEMEKHWKVRNMIVWHLPNRNQGYSSKHKLFSKHDIAMVGTSVNKEVDLGNEDELLEEEYRTALFAITGKPHWESYGKDKKYCPTDFIDYNAADEKSSGQGIIFGIKPLPILIPYIKILTKRGQLVLEPYGGSGSTLMASVALGRRCYIMEKVPTYAQVIINRWEKTTGKKAVKINDNA
jgi:DNA modification methylase